ncbi:tRNA modification GTPase, partial [Lecanoromycetidae sp. Uapishka_2]
MALEAPRVATLRTLYNPDATSEGDRILDSSALVLYFPAPETATGDDLIELHIHGGTAVIKAVLAAIPKTIPRNSPEIVRYAEPGEFTRRAFYNNRLDLLQIEALGDTLAAETEQQRRLAIRGSTNVISERYESWRQKLLYARGELEALIDFSEDQQFDESPAKLCASVSEQVQALKGQLESNIGSAVRGELVRNGINIALIGAPNAGKSSLLNQIVGREAAIVSSEAGTTRDVVDVNVDIGGYYCRFGDLAGLRKQSTPGSQQIGEIEREGMRRAKQRALTADVVIAVLSAERREGPNGLEIIVGLDPEVLRTLKQCNLKTQKIIFVVNKADLFDSQSLLDHQLAMIKNHSSIRDFMNYGESSVFAVSCTSAQQLNPISNDPGRIQAFLGGLTDLFGRMTSDIIPGKRSNNSAWAESLGATERQRVLLQQCLQFLESFLEAVQPKSKIESDTDAFEDTIDVVVAAESLRSAADALAKITGKGEAGDVEEVLGVVFEKYVYRDRLLISGLTLHRFCVGK